MRTDLADDLCLALDAARLFRRAEDTHPDAWQAQLLRSPLRQLILNCSRQAGKSTVSAVLALHTALYQPGALVLVCAPALRQSQELFRKIKAAYATIGGPAACPVEEESALRLELAHGSRIVCLPGKEATIRGFSAVSLLLVDEASRVSDELYRAVRPMLAVSSGRIILLSTPFGKRGFFYEEWANGGATWERYEVPASDCPRIPPDFLEEERRALGLWYAQEYDCQFLDDVNQYFATELIERAFDDEIVPIW